MASPTLILSQITPESALERKSALLRPLNGTLIGISLVGLLIMLVNGSDAVGYSVVIGSLLLNVAVAWLDWRGRTEPAVLIFCHWVNLGVLLLCAANLLIELNLSLGVIFACVLAMNVMLAGMLLGARWAFLIAALDITIVLGLLLRHHQIAPGPSDGPPLALALSNGVPVAGLLLMVAVISGLYQRALARSEERLGQARQRIVEDELLRRDLAVARELQRRLYPPPPETGAAIQIASRSEPARETSGDFYDFIELGEDQLGIVVADVTGKSIAAALVMALARGTLRSEAGRHHSPSEVLRHANRTLCNDRSVRQLVTAFFGVLDTRTMALRFSNAGHPFPFLRRGGQLSELELSGLPLGARADADYRDAAVQLEPGDLLVLISDGLLEERNERREIFGFERLLGAIARADAATPAGALDQIWGAAERFRGPAEQSDDITMVVVAVSEQPAHA